MNEFSKKANMQALGDESNCDFIERPLKLRAARPASPALIVKGLCRYFEIIQQLVIGLILSRFRNCENKKRFDVVRVEKLITERVSLTRFPPLNRMICLHR